MPRLLRPAIPLIVKCRVALRQLGEMWPETVIKENKGRYGAMLADLLARLADLLGCSVAELHLDHNPALGAREKVFRKGVHVDYVPPANDPDSLIYREAGAHRIKTNHHGDGAQHPDRVLIKRQRHHERGPKPKKKHKWASRPFATNTKKRSVWGKKK